MLVAPQSFMSESRYSRHKKAKLRLDEVLKTPHRVFAIHYSCERLSDGEKGEGPGRITGIAVYSFETTKTESFSFGEEYALAKNTAPDVEPDFDALESSMLKKFEGFLKGKGGVNWLVWNMRDLTFGFPAIAHRYKLLGGELPIVPDHQIIDLSDLFWDIYGKDYVSKPHSKTLFTLNGLDSPNLMEGKDEAAAFTDGRYVDVRNSTTLKARYFGQLAMMANDRTLKVEKPWWRQPSFSPTALIAGIQKYWLYELIVIVGAAATFFNELVLQTWKIFSSLWR